MILTYYQSVELMTFLPVLLSPSDTKNAETASAVVVIKDNAEENISNVYQMWNASTSGMEVNGSAFY